MKNADALVKLLISMAENIIAKSRDPSGDAHDLDDLVQDGMALAEKVLLLNRLLTEGHAYPPKTWVRKDGDPMLLIDELGDRPLPIK